MIGLTEGRSQEDKWIADLEHNRRAIPERVIPSVLFHKAFGT